MVVGVVVAVVDLVDDEGAVAGDDVVVDGSVEDDAVVVPSVVPVVSAASWPPAQAATRTIRAREVVIRSISRALPTRRAVKRPPGSRGFVTGPTGHMDDMSHADGRPVPRSVDFSALAGFGAATVLVAWLGSVATSGAADSEWFRSLDKPAFYPPDATFGIVWSVLYVLVAVAGWLAWRAGGSTRTTVPWVVQIVLNLGWSVLFFGLQEPTWALVEIVVLLAAATWAAVSFWDLDRRATALFVPYILWIAFAAVLNASIVVLN